MSKAIDNLTEAMKVAKMVVPEWVASRTWRKSYGKPA